MRSLYYDSESPSRYRYTHEALELDKCAREALVPLFQTYETLGYSPREIGGLLHALIEECVAESILSPDSQEPSSSPSEG